VFHGHKEVINFLLEENVEVDERASIMLDKVDVLSRFVDRGFDPNKTYTKFNIYPIFDAIQFQAFHIIELLINLGINLNNPLDEYRNSTLHLNGTINNVKIFDLLISSGGNVSLKNKFGFTPLHIAARSGCATIVQRLIELGADVNVVAEDFTTPLWQAAYSQDLHTVDLLLQSGASLSAQDYSGRSLLHAALRRKGDSLLAKLLISHGVEVNASDKQGIRPIHIVTAQGDEDLFLFLLEHGASIS
jgi:ankyrin repeat protein